MRTSEEILEWMKPPTWDPMDLVRADPLSLTGLVLNPWRLAQPQRKSLPLRAFPPELLACKNLVALDLSSAIAEDGDQTIPEGFGRLRKLERLSITKSFVEHLPESFGKLTKLREISLEDNPELASLPSTLGNLTRLRRLALNDTPKLRELPRSIGGCKRLEILHMAGSGVRVIPKELWSCTKLDSLVVPDEIEELPPGMSKLTNLGQLVCHPKALLSIAKELPKTSIECLALSVRPAGARRIRLPEQLGRMPKLRSLLVGYSRVILPDSLWGHPELEVLDVLGNGLETVEELALSFPKLKLLDADEGNPIPADELARIAHFMEIPPHRRRETLAYEAWKIVHDKEVAEHKKAVLARKKAREKLRKQREAEKAARAKARARARKPR